MEGEKTLSLELNIRAPHGQVAGHDVAGHLPDRLELLGHGVVQLRLRVGVDGLQPGEIGVLLGGLEGGRRVEGGVAHRVLRPVEALLQVQNLFEVFPLFLAL